MHNVLSVAIVKSQNAPFQTTRSPGEMEIQKGPKALIISKNGHAHIFINHNFLR